MSHQSSKQLPFKSASLSHNLATKHHQTEKLRRDKKNLALDPKKTQNNSLDQFQISFLNGIKTFNCNERQDSFNGNQKNLEITAFFEAPSFCQEKQEREESQRNDKYTKQINREALQDLFSSFYSTKTELQSIKKELSLFRQFFQKYISSLTTEWDTMIRTFEKQIKGYLKDNQTLKQRVHELQMRQLQIINGEVSNIDNKVKNIEIHHNSPEINTHTRKYSQKSQELLKRLEMTKKDSLKKIRSNTENYLNPGEMFMSDLKTATYKTQGKQSDDKSQYQNNHAHQTKTYHFLAPSSPGIRVKKPRSLNTDESPQRKSYKSGDENPQLKNSYVVTSQKQFELKQKIDSLKSKINKIRQDLPFTRESP